MSNLIFCELISPYHEDYTKNCGLTKTEVDGNFLTLKDDDIKNVLWDRETKSLILERTNGVKIKVDGITEGLDDFDFKYDQEDGILYVEANGHSFVVDGFTTPQMFVKYSDDSIVGIGSISKPLSINPLLRPGTFRPTNKLILKTIKEELPNIETVKKGERFITLEKVSNYGLLYDYRGALKIQEDLTKQDSEWRIPSKSDWDGMLNAIEVCEDDKTHRQISSNISLGRFASKYLKSINEWYSEDPFEKGVDTYGFSILPAGFGDGLGILNHFGKRSAFWTSTELDITDIYGKRFDFNKSTVYQESFGSRMLLSIRLVKDFTGDNFNDVEAVNGSDVNCILMPYEDANGVQSHKIWTNVNISFTQPHYEPIEPNNGVDLTYTEKYFINEWDGKTWIKNQLREGESLVIFNGPDGMVNNEYRIIEGVLTNVGTLIYNDLLEVITERLDALNAKIEFETNRAIKREDELDSKIDFIYTALDEKIDEVDTKLDNKIDFIYTTLDNKINESTSSLTDKIDEVDERINVRITTEVDTLNTRITTEVDTLNTRVTTEVETLNTRITDEVNTLDNKLAEETEQRIANDINKTIDYTIKLNGGVTLETNDGSKIPISLDANFGTF